MAENRRECDSQSLQKNCVRFSEKYLRQNVSADLLIKLFDSDPDWTDTILKAKGDHVNIT